MKIIEFTTVYIPTNESVDVLKVKRDEGVRYIVFWKNDPEPTIYKDSDFQEKFGIA